MELYIPNNERKTMAYKCQLTHTFKPKRLAYQRLDSGWYLQILPNKETPCSFPEKNFYTETRLFIMCGRKKKLFALL